MFYIFIKFIFFIYFYVDAEVVELEEWWNGLDKKKLEMKNLSEGKFVDWPIQPYKTILDLKNILIDFRNNIKPQQYTFRTTGIVKEICANVDLWYNTVEDPKENLRKVIKKDSKWYSETNDCYYNDHEVIQNWSTNLFISDSAGL